MVVKKKTDWLDGWQTDTDRTIQTTIQRETLIDAAIRLSCLAVKMSHNTRSPREKEKGLDAGEIAGRPFHVTKAKSAALPSVRLFSASCFPSMSALLRARMRRVRTLWWAVLPENATGECNAQLESDFGPHLESGNRRAAKEATCYDSSEIRRSGRVSDTAFIVHDTLVSFQASVVRLSRANPHFVFHCLSLVLTHLAQYLLYISSTLFTAITNQGPMYHKQTYINEKKHTKSIIRALWNDRNSLYKTVLYQYQYSTISIFQKILEAIFAYLMRLKINLVSTLQKNHFIKLLHFQLACLTFHRLYRKTLFLESYWQRDVVWTKLFSRFYFFINWNINFLHKSFDNEFKIRVHLRLTKIKTQWTA